MKNQERRDIIKKVILIILLIFIKIVPVNANEYPEVTNDIEIRYKWYKEIVSKEGEYYPLSNITTQDKYDQNNYKYVGKANVYNEENCSLSEEYYLLKKRTKRTYQKVQDSSFVLIENVAPETEIKIYYKNIPINYGYTINASKQMKINLFSSYHLGDLLFFVDTDEKYTISIYEDVFYNKKIITKNLENQRFSTPDETWITEETIFTTITSTALYEENIFNKLLEEKIECAYQEKYVYKYDVTKEYYDNNYYVNVDGYIKDENDYKFYYKGEPIIKTIEVIKEKIVEVPKIEYEYIEKIVEVPKVEYEYIEKIVEVPKVEYEYIEKIVEVPKIEYEYIEKIVEVPKVEYVYVEKETNKNDSSEENDCQKENVIKFKTKTIEKKIYKIPIYMYVILFSLIILTTILIIKMFIKNVERNN